jgi:signal transduction histidine kinase
MRLKISLGWKLTIAFAIVLVIALGGVYALTRQATEREVRAYMLHGGQTDAAQLANSLTDFYQANNGWGGVDQYLDDQLSGSSTMGPGHGNGSPGGGMMGTRLLLADADGTVLFNQGMPTAQRLSSSRQASAFELTVDGEVVGYLSFGGGMGIEEQQVVDRLDRAILLAALAGGGAAFVLATVFIIGLLRPVRQLTVAARKLGSGDLTQRVTASSNDEIGELSNSFNEMAGSLEQAEKRRRELTAEIAHELRNPLAVIQARIEGLLDGVYPLNPDELRPALVQSRLLNRLVEDLRLLALVDEGQLELDRRPMDVNRLVREISEAYRPQANKADVDLELKEITAESANALVDAGRISQVVGNLLDNAIRHSSPTKSVFVGVQVSGKDVVITVEDQGEGIAQKDLPHIFSRFYRSDSARSRLEGGSGLGLAIARQLVESHGGTISAANADGGGAQFVVRIPKT